MAQRSAFWPVPLVAACVAHRHAPYGLGHRSLPKKQSRNFNVIATHSGAAIARIGTHLSRASFINNYAKRAAAVVPTADRVTFEPTP